MFTSDNGVGAGNRRGNSPALAPGQTERIRSPASPAWATLSPMAGLAEVLSAELRERWQHGDRVLAEEYLARHPALDASPDAFVLIHAEFLLREERGERPTPEEYRQRFPRHAARLEEQLHVRRRLDPAVERPPSDHPTQPLNGRPEPSSPAASERGPLPEVEGYELLGELGRGGMGVVYKARQKGLKRIVALKMILGGAFADPEFLARFRSEAEAVARLQHPNIVQIFATGTRESPLGEAFACPYFAQEYVDGGNLAERVAGVPQPPREAARFVEALARAVQYAHERGIIHRDLKPANILLQKVVRSQESGVSREDRPETSSADYCLLTTAYSPKISDFGLAKQLDGASSLQTVTGALLGTPEYMAPEQASGETNVGPAADVYALGVILYELVTGRRPFEGDSALETLEQVRHEEPVPPGRLRARTPRDLETICLTCLRKEPERRYASALDLAEDLRRFADGEPIRARPVALPERAWRWACRRPAVAGLAALVVLLALGGAAGVILAWLHALAGWHEADRLRVQAVIGQTDAEQQRELAEERRAESEQRREEAETHLYFSRIAQARLERRLNHPASAERLLDLCLPPDDRAVDRRGWEWYHLKGVLHSDLLTLPSPHEGFVCGLAFSPDGDRLVTGGGSPFRPHPPDRVRVWQVWGPAAGQCLHEFPHPRMVRGVAWQGGGRRVVWVGADGAVRAADVETNQIVLTRNVPARFRPPALSPDGLRYASIDESGRIGVWDLESGRDLLSTSTDMTTPRGLAFSPDGRLLALSGHGTLRLWDVAAGRELRDFPEVSQGRSTPAFSPDGRLVALGTNDGLARLWEVDTGRLVQSLSGHAGGVLAVAFSPDGQCLATGGADHTVRLWAVPTGAELLRLQGHQGRVGCLSFHPSGRYLASGAEQPADVKIWDVTRQQEYVTMPTGGEALGRIEAIGFSGDGEVLYTARATGRLQVSRAASGVDQEVRPLDLAHRWVVPATVATFTDDGARLAAVSNEDPRVVKVLAVAGNRELHRLEHPHEVLHVAFSRDGRRLATSAAAWKGDGRREVRVWDSATGERLFALPCDPYLSGRAYGVVALSPDGRTLASDEHPCLPGDAGPTKPVTRVVVRDLETGRTLHELDGLPSSVDKLAFSPDGRRLAIAGDDHGVVVYDCRAGRWLHQRPLGGSWSDDYGDLAFSPGGQRLAAVSRVQVRVWDVATGELVVALRGAPPRPSDNGFNPRIVWSPDGRRLAASNWNASVSVWDSVERQTPAAKQRLQQGAEERAGLPPSRGGVVLSRPGP